MNTLNIDKVSDGDAAVDANDGYYAFCIANITSYPGPS